MAYRWKTLAEETTYKFKAAAVVDLEQEYEADRNTVPALDKIFTPADGGPDPWLQLGVEREGTQEAAGAPAAPSFSAAPTPGDGQVTLHVAAAAETDVVYAIWRTGSGEFTAPSESFKCTGSGDLAVTGLTNENHYGFLLISKAGGLWSLPSDDEAYATPTDGSTAPTGPISLPLDYLRKTVAGSARFQAEVGAADAAEALDSVLPCRIGFCLARATVAAGAITELTLIDGSSGYRSAPAVAIAGDGAGASATAAISGGAVTGFTITAGGSGYTSEKTEVRVAGPTLPVCMVGWIPDSFKRTTYAGGSHSYFEQEGDLLLLFRWSVNPALSLGDNATVMLNAIGAILEDMEQLAGTAGYLDIDSFTLLFGPQGPDEQEAKTAGDFLEAAYRVGRRAGL